MTDKKPENVIVKWGNKSVTLPLALALSLVPAAGVVGGIKAGLVNPAPIVTNCSDSICRADVLNLTDRVTLHEARDLERTRELANVLKSMQDDIRENRQDTKEILKLLAQRGTK